MNELKPILLIEDDSVDAMTVKRAIRDLHLTNQIIHLTNGEEAVKYLAHISEKPFVILLDLNMPRMTGLEFLKTIKANEILKTIPIIVLTTSKERQDVMESFDLGAVGYMTKPVDYTKFTEVINTIIIYWNLSEAPKSVITANDKI
ncbi:MAG: response regulator [Sedimentisphaerales bacterium]|nr:response regulator [Sedimentisphaerales bacterium]